MMTTKNAASAWQVALALSTIAGTLIASCMMPFAALAVVCVATMSRSRAVTTMILVWATNQLLGFTLLGFPRDALTFAWGVALGVVSLIATIVASKVLAGAPRTLAQVVTSLVAAFTTYEVGLFIFAFIAATRGEFTVPIVAQILLSNIIWCILLISLHAALTRVAPGVFGPPMRFGWA